MIDFTPVLQAIVGLCAAVITTFVVPYVKSKTTVEQQKKVNSYVKVAVTAAEQIYNESGQGEKKKAYVLTWLANHGIAIDEDELDAMIEATVYELTNGVIPVEVETVQEAEEKIESVEEVQA